MEGVSVTEQLTAKVIFLLIETTKEPRMKLVTVKFNFWHKSEYLKQYNITAKALGEIIETKLIPQLERAISRDLANQIRTVTDADADIGVGVAKKAPAGPRLNEDGEPAKENKLIDDEASEDNAVSDDEGEVTNAKKALKHQSTYENDDGEEDSDAEEDGNDDIKVQLDRITDNAKFVCDYKFDKQDGKWCEISFKVNCEPYKSLMQR